MRALIRPFVFLALAATAGCASTGGPSINDMPVYDSLDDIPGSHKLIDFVTPESTIGRTGYGTATTGTREAKRLASQLGADALLVLYAGTQELEDAMMELTPLIEGREKSGFAVIPSRTQYIAVKLLGGANTPEYEKARAREKQR